MITARKNVLVIAASDSGGGAGVERDCRTVFDLGCHCLTAVTALTAQNTCRVADIRETDPEFLKTCLNNLQEDFVPGAIKIGLIPSIRSLQVIQEFLEQLGDKRPFTIYDPVLTATAGQTMSTLTPEDLQASGFLAKVDLITPNLPELALLTRSSQATGDYAEICRQTQILMESFSGSVLVTGGHNNQAGYIYDLLHCPMAQPVVFRSRYFSQNTKHGTGCAVSSAVAAFIAQDMFPEDACTAAIMYVGKAISNGYCPGTGAGTPDSGFDYDDVNFLPQIISDYTSLSEKISFQKEDRDLGLYPVVPSSLWVERLLKAGVKTIQLRIKDTNQPDLEEEICRSIDLGRKYDARVYIDDHWALAVKHQAYGVHLGQEDLLTADLQLIADAGIRLGVSTHGYFEIARVLPLHPSYIALGHIFPTATKVMKSHPQGLVMLNHYARLLKDIPTVAIGGIKEDTLPQVWATGVSGVAVVTAITKAQDPEKSARKLMELMK